MMQTLTSYSCSLKSNRYLVRVGHPVNVLTVHLFPNDVEPTAGTA